jgi:hypothetical protein
MGIRFSTGLFFVSRPDCLSLKGQEKTKTAADVIVI